MQRGREIKKHRDEEPCRDGARKCRYGERGREIERDGDRGRR